MTFNLINKLNLKKKKRNAVFIALSAISAGITSLIYSLVVQMGNKGFRFDVHEVSGSILSGLVAISAPLGFLSDPSAALIIGCNPKKKISYLIKNFLIL